MSVVSMFYVPHVPQNISLPNFIPGTFLTSCATVQFSPDLVMVQSLQIHALQSNFDFFILVSGGDPNFWGIVDE